MIVILYVCLRVWEEGMSNYLLVIRITFQCDWTGDVPKPSPPNASSENIDFDA